MVYVRTSEGTCKLRKCCHTPLCFSLFPFCFFSLIFFSLSASLLPQVFPLLQLNAINDLHLRLIQTLFLHLSHSTPLHKTLSINHYLRIEYFQQVCVGNRIVMTALDAGCARTTRPHWYAYALVKGRASYETVFTPSASLSFLALSLFLLLPSTSLLSLSHSFHQLNTINYHPHPRIIQTLYIHLSRSTPLRKTLTVNHYLRIEYFQQFMVEVPDQINLLSPKTFPRKKEGKKNPPIISPIYIIHFTPSLPL